MLKKVTSILIFMLVFMVFGAFHITADSSVLPFKDIKSNHYAYDEIVKVTSNNLFLSTEEQYFNPNSPISKADAVVAIARALDIDKACYTAPKFIDIHPTDPYFNSICQLTSLGVIDEQLAFKPHSLITRAELLEMLALAFKIEVDSVNDKSFKDIQNHPLKDTIESLADLSIVSGVDQNNFAPDRSVTRSQLAIFICRVIEFQEKLYNHQIIYDYLSKHYIETVNDSPNWSSEVVRLVNEERKKANLPPLQEDPELSQIAVIKAQDFINRNYFEHQSEYYGGPWDLAGLFDYEFTSLGENIARNFNAPDDVVEAWLNSEGHRQNILRAQYTNIGVGVKKGLNGNIYWVQMFSSK